MKHIISSKCGLAVILLSFACAALLILNFLNADKLSKIQTEYDKIAVADNSDSGSAAAVLAEEKPGIKRAVWKPRKTVSRIPFVPM